MNENKRKKIIENLGQKKNKMTKEQIQYILIFSKCFKEKLSEDKKYKLN